MSSLFDFHTHILPAMDDGSRTPEETLAMLRQEMAQGVRGVVATPHFYPQREDPTAFLARRALAEECLLGVVANESTLPAVMMGAEVYAFEGMSDCTELSQLTVAGGEAVLIEMPMTEWSNRLLYELESIQQKLHLTPIVAHIDRYLYWFNTRRVMEQLAPLPVLVQANSRFFLDRGSRRLALRLLREGRIHLLGSDCHGSEKRSPDLGEAVQVIARHGGAEWLERVYQNSVELIPDNGLFQ